VENKKVDKLKKEMGVNFYMSWTSIDTKVYEQGFKNTNVTVECCTIVDVEPNFEYHLETLRPKK